MQQWILDKLYALGQIVATLQQEVAELKARAETADRKAEQNRAVRPSWLQVAIGVASIIVSIASLFVAIAALRAH